MVVAVVMAASVLLPLEFVRKKSMCECECGCEIVKKLQGQSKQSRGKSETSAYLFLHYPKLPLIESACCLKIFSCDLISTANGPHPIVEDGSLQENILYVIL